ncbi:MAG: D-alanyl-D-alanine carboxypeptidase family protein [Gammaproteobacteria bacterium]|jgi:D-alanyl-D-alanine carboxypeptidase (penicillin-binding protein 5/6)
MNKNCKNVTSVYWFIAALLLLILYAANASAVLQRIPDPPDIKAVGYILVDANSGHVIAKNKANERMEPASLTKMMVSYVASRALKEGKISLDDEVTVSEKAWKMKGSRMFIEVNSKVSVRELLNGIIVQSGNDATIALAEHIAGDEESFVELMNEQARRLKLYDTHFTNATGLPDEDHYSTPHDMTMLGIALIRDYPDHYQYYSRKEYAYNDIKQLNRNKLLWKDDSVDGIKTGHTESAGYCLVASAKRGSMRLVSTVLGTKSKAARTTESQKLLTYGFRFFETHKLYSANDKLTDVKIWKGDKESIPLGIADDLYITIPRGQYDKLDASMRISSTILAPATHGDVLGKLIVMLGTQRVAERDLISLDDIAEGSYWHNLVDSVKLWLQDF